MRRLLSHQMRGHTLDGFEAEMHQECCKETNEKPEGTFVPWQALMPVRRQRDLQVNTFSQGGALVPTEVAPVVERAQKSDLLHSVGRPGSL